MISLIKSDGVDEFDEAIAPFLSPQNKNYFTIKVKFAKVIVEQFGKENLIDILLSAW